MRRAELVKKLREKVNQLWHLAANTACGGKVEAVAAVYHDIQELFNEVERIDNASKNGKAATVHGNLCPFCGKGKREVPAEESGKRILA